MSGAILTAIRVSLAITIAGVFMSAIMAFSNLLVNLIIGNVIGEVLALISVCLPFNAFYVFSAMFSAIMAIGGFLVANKIFQLTTSVLDLTK